MNKRFEILKGGMLLLFAVSACSLDIPYENQFSDPDAITTPTAAREFLASAYACLPNPEFELSVLADDFSTTTWISRDADLNNLYKWQTQPLEDLATSLWTDYYAAAALSNAVLERLEGVSVSSEDDKAELRQIECEAKQLIAYSWFNLLRLFATDYADGTEKDGIILKDYFDLGFLSRSSVGDCTEAVRTLLESALSGVPESSSSSVYWFSGESVLYMLSELELYAHRFDKATEYALKLLENIDFDAVFGESVYGSLWSNSSCGERIFSLFTNSSYYTSINYDNNKGDYLTVNKSLADAYTKGDVRLKGTLFTKEMTDDAHGSIVMENCLAKYNKMNWDGTQTQYINKFRLSGAVFVLSEALCRDGKIEDALKVLNFYLKARGAEEVSEPLSEEELLSVIMEEKHKEFVGEGERYFDLKRLRKTLGSFSSWAEQCGKNISEDDYRWTFPIPKGEYLYNENISQNTGWSKIETN